MVRFEEKFERSFQELYGDIVKDLIQQGLMQVDGDRVRMTKRGLFLGDTVAERFILEENYGFNLSNEDENSF